MKTVTVDQFLEFDPCYTEEQIRQIACNKTEWTAADVLNLTEVPQQDRLWAVLREDFVEAPLLHEFACRCAERALSRIVNPDPRSVASIEAKRAWLRGDVGDKELRAAWDAAWAADAASWAAARAAREAALDAACNAAWAARAASWAAAEAASWAAAWAAAEAASWAAARAAADAAARAAREASWAAARAARDAERQWQVDELKKMLLEVTE